MAVGPCGLRMRGRALVRFPPGFPGLPPGGALIGRGLADVRVWGMAAHFSHVGGFLYLYFLLALCWAGHFL